MTWKTHILVGLSVSWAALACGDGGHELSGAFRVEQRIDGYGMADARYINGDYLEKFVEWRDGNTDVSGLAGSPVRLRFECRGTKVYSFQFKQ